MNPLSPPSPFSTPLPSYTPRNPRTGRTMKVTAISLPEEEIKLIDAYAMAVSEELGYQVSRSSVIRRLIMTGMQAEQLAKRDQAVNDALRASKAPNGTKARR